MRRREGGGFLKALLFDVENEIPSNSPLTLLLKVLDTPLSIQMALCLLSLILPSPVALQQISIS